MREDDARGVLGETGRRSLHVRPMPAVVARPQVVEPDEREPGAVSAADDARVVHQQRDAGVTDRRRYGVDARVVVVVAEDGEDAVARRDVGEGARERRGVVRVLVDHVSGDDEEIGADLADELPRVAELALADEETRVKVRDLRDDVPVELLGEAGDAHGDLAHLVVVPSHGGSPAKGEPGGPHDGRPADRLDRARRLPIAASARRGRRDRVGGLASARGSRRASSYDLGHARRARTRRSGTMHARTIISSKSDAESTTPATRALRAARRSTATPTGSTATTAQATRSGRLLRATRGERARRPRRDERDVPAEADPSSRRRRETTEKTSFASRRA